MGGNQIRKPLDTRKVYLKTIPLPYSMFPYKWMVFLVVLKVCPAQNVVQQRKENKRDVQNTKRRRVLGKICIGQPGKDISTF